MVSKIKVERVKKGFTQFDIAMRTGIAQWRISLIERGISPKKEEMVGIAKALNKEVGYLFNERE